MKGKMARQPSPKEAEHSTKGTLNLIHTGVCGPMQTVTPGKEKYVMTLIDDFSRYTTVHFIEAKVEAGMHIKRSIKMASTQFNKTPKCIRSDRGQEYVNADLQNYLKIKG